jgi:Xaa-Pro aminopeptidase
VLQPGHGSEEYILFVRPRDRERETWTGRRAGVEGAVTDFGAAMAYPIDELDQRLPKLIGERNQLYYAMDRDEASTRRVMG